MNDTPGSVSGLLRKVTFYRKQVIKAVYSQCVFIDIKHDVTNFCTRAKCIEQSRVRNQI